MKCSIPLKTFIILVVTCHANAISTKTYYFVTLCPYFLKSMDHWHYPSKYLKKVAYWLKTLKILVSAPFKLAISAKSKYFGTFCLFFLNEMDLFALFIKLFQKIHRKIKSVNILIRSQLQAKHFVILKKKEGGIMMVLSKKNKAKMLVNILLKRFAFTLKASSVK